MRYALLLVTSLIALTPPEGTAGSLNKCVDPNGQITYSNLPCKNAQETRKLALDPPPLPDSVKVPPKNSTAKPAQPVAKRTEASASPALEIRRSGKPPTQTSAGKCNTLAEKLGRVIDKMDTARRQGYTQAQMDDWNQQVRDLERQKQQADCF